MRMRVGRAAMDDWQAEHGIFTPDEIAAARAEMAAADTEYLGNFGSTSSAA
jgi:predicted flap endonuclease-1-like 5' DNA nuclease